MKYWMATVAMLITRLSGPRVLYIHLMYPEWKVHNSAAIQSGSTLWKIINVKSEVIKDVLLCQRLNSTKLWELLMSSWKNLQSNTETRRHRVMSQSNQDWPHGRKNLEACNSHGNQMDHLTRKKVTDRKEWWKHQCVSHSQSHEVIKDNHIEKIT